MTKYTESQIHRVCELLVEGETTSNDIAVITQVGHPTVNKIRSKERWNRISDKYDFANINYPIQRNILEDSVVHAICELLVERDLTHYQIAKKLSIEKYIVGDISSGKSYKRISKKYDFSEKRTNRRTYEEDLHYILYHLERKKESSSK